MSFFATPEDTGVWVVDVQERLFPHIDRSHEVLERICFALRGLQPFSLPLIVTEQFPEKLGHTLEPLKALFPQGQKIYPKTTFSGYADAAVKKAVDSVAVSQWILIGIEAHICVLQTAKDLIMAEKRVMILNDAISSRSLYDFSTAIGELRDCGARITSTETILYELLRDARRPEFKHILSLITQES